MALLEYSEEEYILVCNDSQNKSSNGPNKIGASRKNGGIYKSKVVPVMFASYFILVIS